MNHVVTSMDDLSVHDPAMLAQHRTHTHSPGPSIMGLDSKGYSYYA